MENNEKIRNIVIKDICEELNIEYKSLSKDWIIQLKKDNKIRYISGYKFDLNNHAIGEIIDDKYGLYEILKDNGIPIIEHNILYEKDNDNTFAIGCNDYNLVKDYYKNHNNIVVIKPNNGTCGRNVYKITDINDIDQILEKIFQKHYSLSYCPYYNIKNEYRIIILDKEEQIIYKKVRPIIKGNGINTIKELLIEFNESYFKDRLEDEEYNRVLDKDEVFEYNWKFNLSEGAKADLNIEEKSKEKIETIVKNITKKFDMNFVSIDIIETEDNNFYVMEINSGVMMNNIYRILGQNIVYNIYKKAIKKMFEKKD